MKYFLDTSLIIDLEKNNRKNVQEFFSTIIQDDAEPTITFMVYFEFLLGFRKKSLPYQLKAMNFINKFTAVMPTKETANLLCQLKAKYESRGTSLPFADALIAAQVIEHHGTLVTCDRGFSRIEELKCIVLT